MHQDEEAAPEAARRAIRLTGWGMVWERAAHAFWPLAAGLAAVYAALALGLVETAPAAALPWLAGAAVLGLLAAAIRGGLRFRRVEPGAAAARVDATLPGRPLSALADTAAIGGEGELWQAHRAQMAARAQAARPVAPDAGLARRDPFALRLTAALALAMALIFGTPADLGRGMQAVAAAIRPEAARGPSAPAAPAWEGWAEPPAYTRRPTLYLNALAEGAVLELPEGTGLSFRLYGEGVAVVQDIGPPASGEGPQAPAFVAERSGRIEVGGRVFEVIVAPDAAPVVAAGAAPARRADGRLVQDFTAEDDHGIVSGAARIALDLTAVERRFGLAAEPEPRAPVVLALPVPRGDARLVRARLTEDLARHPWANLPVTLTLEVEDGIAQPGTAAPLAMLLPGRRFFDPLAAALIELRRDLLWSRSNAARSAEILRALTWQPEGLVEEPLYHELRGAVALLEGAPLSAEARDKLAEALWQAAVKLEDGGLADALERMKQAQEKLSEAIRNGASPDEIQRLMDELKAATDAYTEMLAEQGEQTDPAERFTRNAPQGQAITGDQIRQMMDEIQRLMNEGRMAEAQQLLEQFNRMMENLQVRQGEAGEGRTGRGAPGGQPMDRLSDTLRRQQELADEAFREMQRGFGGARPGEEPGQQPGEQPGTGGQPGAGQQPGADDGGSMADRQRALRQGLGQSRGLLPGQGTPQGDEAGRRLDQAGRAMDEAERALREGDLPGALDRQADAIEALREGMRALDQMTGQRREAQDGQQGEGEGEGNQPDGPVGQMPGDQPGARSEGPPRLDPLGRQLSGDGNAITTGEPLAEGGADPARRARDLQDEIRRRSGERARPEDERNYLGRLLDRF